MSKHRKKQQYVQTQPKTQGRGFLSKVITFVGFISVLNAIISLVAGYGTFQTQWEQTEWPATTAQVVEVSQGNDANQNPTPAEIRYEYQVDDTTYQGTYQEDSIVKRVIATEGQTVDIDYATGTVYVDGQPLEEDYIKEQMQIPSYGEGTNHVTVPEGCLFVMGDNRNQSADSRYSGIGIVDERCVIGRAVMVLFPFAHFGTL